MLMGYLKNKKNEKVKIIRIAEWIFQPATKKNTVNSIVVVWTWSGPYRRVFGSFKLSGIFKRKQNRDKKKRSSGILKNAVW